MPDGSKKITSISLVQTDAGEVLRQLHFAWGVLCAARELGHEVSLELSYNWIEVHASIACTPDWKCPRCGENNRGLSPDCSECCAVKPEPEDIICLRCGEPQRIHQDRIYCREPEAGRLRHFKAGGTYAEMDVHHEDYDASFDPKELGSPDQGTGEGLLSTVNDMSDADPRAYPDEV